MVSIPRPARHLTVPATQPLPAVRVLAVVSMGYLLASWAMAPVSAILPTITADLAIGVEQASWLMNAYFVVLVGGVLTAGRLGDAFGHGAVFRLGCLTFAGGSLLAALPAGYALLLIGRSVQGLGSAMVFGTSLALVASAYRGRRLGWAVGVLTMSSGLSAITGVWTSTSLVLVADWHWAFVLPGAIGVVAAAHSRGLPSVRRTRASEVDWLGGALLFGTVALALLGLSHLHEGPETFEAGAPYHLSLHLGALALLGAFLWRQLRAARPLIQLQAFRNTGLTAGVIANGIAHSSMLATTLLIPFLLERGRGYSPNETAQLLLVQQGCILVGAYGGGWLYARRATPAIAAASIGGIALGLLVLGGLGADLPFAAFFPLVALNGTGIGAFTAANNTAVMSAVARDQAGFASGLVEMTRQLGHSVGVSISSALLATHLASASLPALGYRQGFAEAASTMGIISTAGVLIVLWPIVRSRLAPSRRVAAA